MGIWDSTTPLGSDPISEGDDRMRELKAALQEALSHEFSTFPGASPSSTPIFIPGFLMGDTIIRPTGDSLVEGRLFLNTQLHVIERYNGSSWDTIFTLPADGTIDENKLAASVAGPGLVGGAGDPFSVNVDNSTLEISSDTVRIKDGFTIPGMNATNINLSGYIDVLGSIKYKTFATLPILQIGYHTTDTRVNITSASFSDSGSAISFSTKLSNSKVLVIAMGTGLQNAGDDGAFTIAVDGVNQGPANGLAAINASSVDAISMMIYYTPGDTSSHTYRVRMKSNAGSASTEYPYLASGGQTRATMIIIEIAQ